MLLILKKYLHKRNGCKQLKNYYINAQQQITVPYGSMLHIPPTNLPVLSAKQEPYKKSGAIQKSLSLNEKY